MYELTHAVQQSNEIDKAVKLKIFIKNLPELRRNTLALIIIHLKRIAKKSNYDLKVMSYIETIFGPTLIRIDVHKIPHYKPGGIYHDYLLKIISEFLNLSFMYWNSIIDYESITAQKPILRKRNDLESSMESASDSASSEQMVMKDRRRGGTFNFEDIAMKERRGRTFNSEDISMKERRRGRTFNFEDISEMN
ncbi:uncharacterized protein LOC127285130 [Leptopilina boulardi]|uniref:uncharacterized protein LOC127285130 n=1 Tax=Leptopilina boulardi TaxID=63433 RepID=UPI0021F55F99|nr:uncharacterized protein LOC127285130 [Leptopilina boulardi]XP_051166924.1 uncharacterized protein LOC127285130 [Leptopilina boulardi]